jgi:hypothetical protein
VKLDPAFHKGYMRMALALESQQRLEEVWIFKQYICLLVQQLLCYAAQHALQTVYVCSSAGDGVVRAGWCVEAMYAIVICISAQQ